MKKKDMLLLFIFLALISFSDGILYNFQELWMTDNNFSLKTISIIYSLCSLITVSTIFLCSNLITKENLKKFVITLLSIKIICIFFLYLLYSTGLSFFIKFFIMIDFVVDVELVTSIYPMMSLIRMDNKEYAKKDIIYNAAYYFGVILTIFLLGKKIFFNISYNSYLFFALIMAILALMFLCFIDLNKYIGKEKSLDKNDKLIVEKLFSDIKHDRISKLFLSSMIANQLSYNCGLGLIIVTLTKVIGLNPSKASGLSMILGIISVFIGSLVLTKLTFKNNYINITIKYGGRLLFYILAALFGTKMFIIIAISYAKLSSLSYSHVVDAPYVNRICKDYQLAFCNLKEMVTYFGKSIGFFLCGLFMNINIRLNYMFAAIFIILEIYLRMLSLKYRLIAEGNKK